MRENLKIEFEDKTIYVMNCLIKPVGLGLFWHIKTTPSLEKLLDKHHIVFAKLISESYTGNISVYRFDKETLSIELADKDVDAEIKKFERRTFCIITAVTTISIVAVNALLCIIN